VAVLLVLALVVVTVGSLFGWIVLRWPTADPTDTRIEHGRVVAEVTRHRGLRKLLRRHADPGTTTGVAVTLGGLVVVVGSLTVGVVLAMVRSSTGLADLDLGAARWAARHATFLSTEVLRTLTRVGGTLGIVVLAVAVLAANRRRLPVGRAAAFLVLVLGGQNLVNNTVKFVIDRSRPAIDPLAGFAGSSFPSGHSSTAAAGLAAFALLLGRGRPLPTKALLAGAAGGFAAGVAATRVLLGVHWLTDVVAGFALGWAWFALCSIAFGGRLLRFGAPVADAASVATEPVTAGVGVAGTAGPSGHRAPPHTRRQPASPPGR
jgi:membrane-associated phospholipid phosphatase